jgi:hypothetical protein
VKIFNHPNLPPDVYVLPLTPGSSSRFGVHSSTADIWGNRPNIQALSAPESVTLGRLEALGDPRMEINSIQPGTKSKSSTEDIWNRQTRKRGLV